MLALGETQENTVRAMTSSGEHGVDLESIEELLNDKDDLVGEICVEVCRKLRIAHSCNTVGPS